MTNISRDNSVLSKAYLFSYILFVFTQIIFKDSELAGHGGSAQNPIASYICYIAIAIAIGVNIFVYFFSNNSKNIFSMGIFISLISIFIIFTFVINIPVIVPSFFLTVLFIFNVNTVSFLKFIKYDFITRLIAICFVFLMLIFHMISDITRPAHGGGVRYSLGFTHPDTLGIVFLTLFISGLFLSTLFKTKRNYLFFFISMAITYLIIYKVSDCREFQVGGIIILISLILKNSKWWKYLCKILMIPSFILSIIFYIYYAYFSPGMSSSLYILLNNISSNRLYALSLIMTQYRINLFGYKNLLTSLNVPVDVDDIYGSILLNCGIIGLIMYGIALISLIFISIKLTHNAIISILIIILSISSITSGYSSDLMITFLIAYSYYFYICYNHKYSY